MRRVSSGAGRRIRISAGTRSSSHRRSSALRPTRALSVAETMIRSKRYGDEFIGEDVVIRLAELGYSTGNAKAIGPVIKRMSRKGVVAPTGRSRRARTSHGSQKPIWRRS